MDARSTGGEKEARAKGEACCDNGAVTLSRKHSTTTSPPRWFQPRDSNATSGEPRGNETGYTACIRNSFTGCFYRTKRLGGSKERLELSELASRFIISSG